MRTLAPPAGRGYEYLTGTGWDFAAELAEIPALLAAKLAAPSVQAGRYDLVIDPSNLFLTIHESIGHATELDRALGYEAAYAGTSFATFDKLGTLQYGSPVMHVTGDRTAEHGLATIGYDDEGVAGQSWDLITGGVLTGYQLDRRIARLTGLGRSNGCAFADSPGHMPIQRMANVSLQPAADGPSTEQLIAGVTDGIYIVGDKSWSIDMQRYNFQFTGQRFFRIKNGQLAGPAPRRRLPGDDHGLLELHGSGRRPADLCARRRVQLRQGPAWPGGAGQPRLPVGGHAGHQDPQHSGRGRGMSARASQPGRIVEAAPAPQELVERALAAARCDDCIVIADEGSTANLRWAGNSLTTNGVSRSRQLTVIAISRSGDGARVGVVSRAGVRADQVADLVAEAEHAAAEASPAEDAQPLVTPPDAAADSAGDWDEPPGATADRGIRRFRRGARPRVRHGRQRWPEAVWLRRARADLDLPRHLHAACGCATTSRPGGWSSTPSPPT